ncbi:PRC-barrel domain-containing protein [Caldicoprobacter algeriensis]|uniref:PRC-barrel domain-containing protein n=1 Tax=Caldicoprobacter algeriensis TaxID=699281 RepID=UPI002079D270|nr:PRC-barrel domain-containing protein [Caldicoprobacter algeriensis]MCM8901437.1 PRC-barrel domain-containing protein [Caldicoprobacter algeriensis]
MKAMHDVEGLPVICVREGIECGRVRELLINCCEGNIQYLIIEDEEWYLGAKLLPFDKVLGIGRHAVITESEENILPFSQVKEAHDLIRQGMGLTGARVYTQKGEYIGNVKEYYFDEKDGRVVKCELHAENQKSFELDASQIVTYGKGILVVSNGVSEAAADASKGLPQEVYKSAENADYEQSKYKGSSLFEQKQRRFLLGKRVTKRIISESGELLAVEGDIVTDELIDKVKAGGKLVELTMNIEAV